MMQLREVFPEKYLKRSREHPMTDKTEFQGLVDLDLKGKADEIEVAELMKNLTAWKQSLVQKLQDIDNQLQLSNAQTTKPMRKDKYDELVRWRRGALVYKNAVLKRMSDVKVMMAQNTIVRQRSFSEIGEEMLVELREINKTLGELADHLLPDESAKA